MMPPKTSFAPNLKSPLPGPLDYGSSVQYGMFGYLIKSTSIVGLSPARIS